MSQVEEFVGCRVIEFADNTGNENHLYSQWLTKESIVRCRDCKKSDPKAYDYCEFFYANGRNPNGFCAWGER